MAKAGRNDPCPCGSGKKYKKCCLPTEETAALEVHAKAQAEREARAAADRLRDRQIRAEMRARWAADDTGADGDPLDAASNAVIDLIEAGKLEEAEAAARDLLVRYPDVHDGWDRLGMVYEARSNSREAADCYRKVIDLLRQHPDYADPEMAEDYAKLVAKLDPPAAD
jgi:tetratricopeptide (TPR) repeat protein